MTIPRDRLRQASTPSHSQPHTIAALMGSLHRSPALRDWITLETVALPPIPVRRQNRWHLLALLSRPLSQAPSTWLAPWGVVEWSWPAAEVIQTRDLRHHAPFQHLRAEIPSAALSTAGDTLAQHTAELYAALDTCLAADVDESSFVHLAPYYAASLPVAFYPYYHALAPDSQTWLQPASVSPPTTALDITPKAPPVAPSTSLANGLAQALSLAQTYHLDSIATELRSVQALEQRPGFRLAVVGEFSRGKSTLINRLLERDLLPTGAPPTTATLVAITAAPQEAMTLHWPTRPAETRPLAPDSWADILATNPDGQSQDIAVPIQVAVNSEWLRSLDMELVDTPGAGDLSPQRAALVADILSQCDAAVMVVSASLPLSRTEQHFLETQVLGRHIPQVLVAVSKLDTIPIAERPQVCDAIQSRVARITPAVSVLPLHGWTDDCPDADTIPAIRRAIAQLADQDQRHLWRDQQIRDRLSAALQQIQALGTAGLEAQALSQTEQQSARQRQEDAIAQADIQWQQITLDFRHRRLQLATNLRQRLFAAQAEWREALHYDLSRTPEPKTWWERDLPFRLGRELTATVRQAEGFLLKTLAQDTDWLQQSLAQQFGEPWTVGDRPDLKADLQPNLAGLSLADTQRYRLFARLGSSAAVVCGYLLGGPIGVVASTSIWLLGEQIVNQHTTEQRQLLDQELDRRLDEALEHYLTAVGDRLDTVYDSLLQRVGQAQRTWQTEQRRLLDRSAHPVDATDWQACIDQAIALEAMLVQFSPPA